jgi:hypothetical protein
MNEPWEECMIRSQLAAIALVALLAVPFRSASAFEATPFVGAMIPANSLVLQTSGTAGYFRMQTHTVYGLSLGTVAGGIGVEAVLGVGTGKMELLGGSDVILLQSTAFMADLRGRLRLLGVDESQLGLVLGVGYTDHKLGLFDVANETNVGDYVGRLTGVAGVDLRSDLSERLHLRVSVVDRIHKHGISITGLGGPGVSEKTQNDIVTTAGLAFSL